MAKSQQEYSAEFEKQGLDKLNTSAAERRQQDEKTIQQLNSTIDRQAALATKPYEEQIDELGVQARDAYDLSAIQEQVDRRQAEEAMASLGLTGSGLAHTQQQAAGVRRSKTDAGVRREVDRQSTALQSKIDQLLENASIDKQEKADAIRTATDEWENASRDSIREQSVTVGAQLYDSEAQREFDREENQKQRDLIIDELKKDREATKDQMQAQEPYPIKFRGAVNRIGQLVNKSYEYEGDERLQWENQAVYELKNLVENSEYSFTDEQIENMCRDAGVSFPYFLDVIGKNLDPLRAVG